MDIILLNGPPGCGKDTIARMLGGRGYVHCKFAAPLRTAVAVLLGIEERDVEDAKRIDPRVRQLMISLSEVSVKPLFGRDWFGAALGEDLAREEHERVVISDCGFADEVQACLAALARWRVPVRPLLVLIERPGCTFDGDSRSYIALDGVATIGLCNDGTLETLSATVDALQ